MDQVSFLPSVLEAALKSALKAVVNKTVLRGYEAVYQVSSIGAQISVATANA